MALKETVAPSAAATDPAPAPANGAAAPIHVEAESNNAAGMI